MSGNLNHSPATIIQQLIVDKTLARLPSGSGDWPIYSSFMPDGEGAPSDAIATFDTTGRNQGRTQIDGEVQENHGVQIMVRADKFNVGYAKSRTIATTLDEDVLRQTVSIDGTDYLVQCVNRVGDVIPLGKEDGTNRRLFTINVLVVVTQS